MFGLFKKKKNGLSENAQRHYIVVNLNARLQPMHRGDILADPLDEFLQKNGLGAVVGGGTLQSENGEVAECDIEIEVPQCNDEVAGTIKEFLEEMGVPKSSKLVLESNKTEMPIGTLEGLALYLNGTDLDDSVYQTCDSNFVYSELERLTGKCGNVYSYWQGNTETAFYLYGPSFGEMKGLIKELIDTYPLCQKSRIEQIA